MGRALISNLGFILQTAGILIILPILVAFFYQEKDSALALLLTSFIFLASGFMMNALAERKDLDFKSSCMLVTLTFFILSFIGTLPYLYLGIFNSNSFFNNFVNSYFESISGYTTTGFSLLDTFENLPRSIVVYRSLTQWIGGIGIVYLILAFFYREGVLNNLLEAIGFRKTLSKIKSSMLEVIFIYAFYTVVYFLVFYLLGLQNLVSNFSLVFSSLSSGGFSPVKDIGMLGDKVLVVLIIAMITGATSFYIHHSLFFRKFKNLLSEEFLLFLFIIFLSSFLFFKMIRLDIFTCVFHVVSAITTTGFSFLDFSNLGEPIKLFLTLLMFIGGCSFSTSSGIKVYRLLLLFKSVVYIIKKKLGYETKCAIDKTEVGEVDIAIHMHTILLSLMVVFISSYLFCFLGYNFVDSLFECVSAFSNVGFSIGIVGIRLGIVEKIVLILLMGIGRVEIMVFLISLFYGKEK